MSKSGTKVSGMSMSGMNISEITDLGMGRVSQKTRSIG